MNDIYNLNLEITKLRTLLHDIGFPEKDIKKIIDNCKRESETSIRSYRQCIIDKRNSIQRSYDNCI